MAARQPTLFGTGEPSVRAGARWERIELAGPVRPSRPPGCNGAWIDVARAWLDGHDSLLDLLIERVEWRQGRRVMWERVVDDPRLSRWFRRDDDLPHPALHEIGQALDERYGVHLRGPACNYYRDGRDSVAFHADRELRDLDDAIVAIVTLGARRPFLVRPKGGGRSIDLAPAGGDVLVMGGAAQRDHQHAVPKVAHAGPRISLSWRWSRAG